MKKLQVLGPGCPRCNQLAERLKLASRQLGLECEIEKVTDVTSFADFGVMVTPALVVDGDLKFQGKLPSIDELKQIIS